MSGNLGSLLVSLGLDAADFTSGLTKAERDAEKFSKKQQAAYDGMLASARALGAGIGLAAGAAATGFAVMVKGQIDAVDQFNDLADASGASIENISALDDVARRTGANFEVVEATVLKLNQALNTADGKNGTSQALKAIGLTAEELRKLDPAEAVLVVAKALDGYADDGTKARLMQELLGKSAKEIAPFLKDLAEQGQLVAKVTTKQAEEVDRYNKSLAALKATAEDFARTVGLEVLPSLNKALVIFSELAKGPGLGAAFGEVLKGNSFTSAQSALDAYRAKVAEVDKQIEKIKADKRPLIQANAAGEIANLEKQRAQLQRFADAYRNILNSGSAGAGRGSAQKPDKPNAPDGGGGNTGKAAAAAFTDYSAQIAQATARMIDSSAIVNIQKLNDQLKELDKLQAAGLNPEFLSEARAKTTTDLVAAIIAKTEEASDAFRRLELNATQATNGTMYTDGLKRFSDQAAQFKATIDGLNTGNQALRDEITILTGGEEARRAVEQARMSSAIALKEETLALRERNGAAQPELDALREEIRLLQERQALTGKRNTVGDQIQKASEFQRTIDGALRNTFSSALEGDFKSISQMWKRLLIDMAAEAAAAQLSKALFGGTAAGAGATAGGGTGIWGAVLGWLFSAKGNAFDQSGRIPFANGGVVNGATPFMFGGGRKGVMGEAGPEAILPLRRGRNGRLGVAMEGGGQDSGAVVINQTINVQAGASRNELMLGMQAARRAAVNDITEAQRRGRFFT